MCEHDLVKVSMKGCNIPNFQFGMLYIRSSLHSIFYCILANPRNPKQLKDPRRELGIFPVFIFDFLSNNETRILVLIIFLPEKISY